MLFVGLWAGAAQGAVLYDQTANGTDSYLTSNDFVAPGDDLADDQVADDFTVPAGQVWTIDEVDVEGFFTGTPPPTVNVFIYANAGSLPGGLLFSQLFAPATNGANYTVPIAGAPALQRGTKVTLDLDIAGTPLSKCSGEVKSHLSIKTKVVHVSPKLLTP